MAGVKSKGFPFHRTESSIAVTDKCLLNTVEQSVGLITIERLITGEYTREIATGFLVGNGCFMTVYHVLENKIDDIIQDIARFMPDKEKWERWMQTHSSGVPDLSKVDAVTAFIENEKIVSFQNFTNEMDDKDSEEFNRRLKGKWDQCCVVFPKPNSSHQLSEEMVFFFDQCIPFADKESDVLILKISEKPDYTLPNSLILQEKYENTDKVSLYGYLKPEGKEELHLDIYCSVYTDASKLENDVAKAKRYWEDKEKDTETRNHNYQKINFTEEFQDCSASFNKENGKITLHTSETFVQGTSGSPILIIKRIGDARKPVVNGMYQRGFPSFYYEVEESIRMKQPLPSNKAHYNKFRDVINKENAVKPNHLFESGVTMEHIANILKGSKKPNFLSLWNSIFSTRGPEVGKVMGSGKTATSAQPPVVNDINRTVQSMRNVDVDDFPCYKMDAKPRGYAVIINNTKFYSEDKDSKALPERRESNTDAERLNYVFKKLDFIVEKYTDLTSTQMCQMMSECADRCHRDYDCFVCCILSHGALGHVYGVNGKIVPIGDLTRCFQSQNCPTLAGKPKLFFIQACQRMLYHGEVYDIEDTPAPRTQDLENDLPRESIPDDSDFLLGYATAPGNYSYRRLGEGSWYIKHLAEMLDQYADRHDLMSIMVKVNEEVGREYGKFEGGLFKQIPAPLVTLRKKLYFR